MRSETDTGVISILDIRACENGRYHQDVLDALPKCRKTESVEDIRGFLKEKKDEAFFD